MWDFLSKWFSEAMPSGETSKGAREETRNLGKGEGSAEAHSHSDPRWALEYECKAMPHVDKELTFHSPYQLTLSCRLPFVQKGSFSRYIRPGGNSQETSESALNFGWAKRGSGQGKGSDWGPRPIYICNPRNSSVAGPCQLIQKMLWTSS